MAATHWTGGVGANMPAAGNSQMTFPNITMAPSKTRRVRTQNPIRSVHTANHAAFSH